MIKTIITILIPFLLFSVNAFGADWYISTTGNDTTGDGSSELPWATTAKARKSASAIAAGDTVIFKNGTYIEGTHFTVSDLGFTSGDNDGTAENIITYKAETTGSVTIDCNSEHGFQFFSAGCSYFTIEGFNIINYEISGIRVDALGITVKDCTFYADNASVNITGGVETHYGSTFVIDNCTIENTDLDLVHGIYIAGGSGTVKDSVFKGCTGNGIQIQAGDAEHNIGTVYVYRNKVYGNTDRNGIYVNAYGGGSIDAVHIYNNFVWNNGKNYVNGYGINIYDTVTYAKCVNNTVYDNRAGIAQLAASGIFQNNIVVASTVGSNISSGTGSNANITKSYNLTTDGDEGVDYGVLGAFATTDFESTTDTDEDFLKLKSTASTAINAGTDTGVTDDYFETVRDVNIDIGAHEYASTATTHSKSFAGGCGNIR